MTIRDLIDRARAEEYITVQELSVLTRVHPQTLWRLARKGELPGAIRVGRGIRIRRKEALAGLDEYAPVCSS